MKAAPETEGYKADPPQTFRSNWSHCSRHVIKNGLRVLILLEGRDASGKDRAVNRMTAHLSPRDTRVVALGSLPTTTQQLVLQALRGQPAR